MSNFPSAFPLLTDSYKLSHWLQYPPTTRHVYSFLEARTGEGSPDVTFFGLQYILNRYFTKRVRPEDIELAAKVAKNHMGSDAVFNRDGWKHIVDAHGGYLPLRIMAVPEGLTVSRGNVLVTVENTDPDVPWLTNYAETILSQVWYPSTVCTQSRAMKANILAALRDTGTPDAIDFKLHDFGFRGSTSIESAGIGGAAHLVNFKGTDTMAALALIAEYYGESENVGFSIPAAEHSTITSWGEKNEEEAYRNMLRQYPDGLVAVVSDSYDIFRACQNMWGQSLRSQVMGRNGVLVVRPDSGYPPTIVVKVLDILGGAFGYRINRQGYKVLDEHVRVIQGDGIDPEMLVTILKSIRTAGWSADNLAFGSGGGLLQKLNRDTLRFAFKASAIYRGGQWHDVIKHPVTDPGKTSKAGALALIQTGSSFQTVKVAPGEVLPNDMLQPVFENGAVTRFQTFSDIRTLASQGL